MATSLRLRLLGPVSIERHGSDAGMRPVTQPRRLALLAYLLLAKPRGFHARETLVALFWPELDQFRGRHALRSALHALRSALGEKVLLTAGDGLIAVDTTVIACDALELEGDLAAGRTDEAIERYKGELLRGFHISGAPAFEDWLAGERLALHEMVVKAALARVDEAQASGDGERALREGRRAYRLDPDHEGSLRKLIALLDDGGDRAGAVRLYDDFAERLRVDCDAEPHPSTRDLVDRMRMRRGPAARLPTSHGEAYVHYVRGTYLFLRAAHGGNAADMHGSRTFFEAALAVDDEFALAYAGLANYYAVAAIRDLIQPFHVHFARAIELSHRALALDPTLAIPHVHFGVKAMYMDGDWEAAGRELGRAVELDGSYAEARRLYANWLLCMGENTRALHELREAIRLEPQMAIYRNALGDALLGNGQLEESRMHLQHALELDPGYAAARQRLLRVLERMGHFTEAVTERARHPALADADAFRRAFESDGDTGYRRERARELHEWIAGAELSILAPPVKASELFNARELRLALAFAELGDMASAAAWEDRACRTKPSLRPWFSSHPDLRNPVVPGSPRGHLPSLACAAPLRDR